MKRLMLASACALTLATIPASADVMLDFKLSGTGDNVVFESLLGSLAVGSFNGQHTGLVDFTDLSGNSMFTGAANGNDIKIANTSNLFVQVFDSTGTTVQPTATQVFSLKGTGDVTAFIQASLNGVPEAIKTFDLGVIDPNAQSGFTFTAINGEVMTSMRLLDATGNITDYEHYRIDVASAVGVPSPVAGAGIPGLFAVAMLGLVRLRRRRLAG
jgi:hypothetical protein